ncbi:Arm DNA-binding domain-containing protein [Comamonas sp.]|uniref:Arm DNA-binding domain-containing protein n=1 Tax=Comamonas sp. TaxID=34028 RepID=UPI00258F21F5|nr:Arm DNA-binding domain-containing protein [Comamonas sp.]
MYFHARSAKSLKAGEHVVINGCLGLRLVASNSNKSWIYRFKSPIDDRMRQVKIGQWPSMALSAAVANWEGLRKIRESGVDPSLARKERRSQKKEAETVAKGGGYTMSKLVEEYLSGYIIHHRIAKNARARLSAASVYRADCFNGSGPCNAQRSF